MSTQRSSKASTKRPATEPSSSGGRPKRRGAPPSRATPRDAPPAHSELRLHGVNAVLAHFRAYPDSTVRLFLREDRLTALRDVVRYCTQRRLVYRVVDDAQLLKISGASHHEGTCLVARPRPNPKPSEVLPRDRGLAVVLDGIENPHNLGALLRTAAHFGCSAALLCGVDRIAGATYRVAQGGASLVATSCTSTKAALDALQDASYTIYVCRADGDVSLTRSRFSERTAIVLGNERRGVSPLWSRHGASSLRIDGTGAVESLNVAAAGAVVMGNYWSRARP